MEKIADFEKVSYVEFEKAYAEKFPEIKDVHAVYESICLPKRATAGSAGYDFFAPSDFTLTPGETITIPTGIRARMENGYVLLLFPRSGLGFKYRLQLDNTVGVIDSDYYGSDNEGHIFCRITNDSKSGKNLEVKAGEGFIQGVFLSFGITRDDEASAVRNGGFGSTTK